MKLKRVIFFLFPILLILGIFAHKPNATYLFGEARWRYDKLPESTIKVPDKRTIQWEKESEFAKKLIQQQLKRESNKIWDKDKKSGSPKAILRQLLAEENIPEVNRIIQSLKPWGTSGSAWLLNPDGGYNFALTPLTSILFLFDDKPEILYPETKKHLLEVLLTEEGGGFTDAVPNLLGRVKDSENHVLMAQGSKYLKNHYLWSHGNRDPKYNNLTNGMEEGILNLLQEHKEQGLYEFNSMPYSAYAITPLLNLEAFGSEEVRKSAREVLDYICFTYALGSYNLNYYPPFRRRLDRHKITSLSKHYETVFMKSWLSFHPEMRYNTSVKTGLKHALMAVALPYRPADKVIDLLFNKSQGYFVKLGHGVKSCPEIYSAGDGYLLSAGGANQGKWSIIVARPTCLFLNDNAQHLNDVIHLKGAGNDFMKWNNTGLYKNFACTNGSVHIPEKFTKIYSTEIWDIYELNNKLLAAVHQSDGLSILLISQSNNPKKLANNLQKNNPEMDKLRHEFQIPDGDHITYDVDAPKNKWLIKTINSKPVDRKFDNWPLLIGHLY